jgi:hypothetical protein
VFLTELDLFWDGFLSLQERTKEVCPTACCPQRSESHAKVFRQIAAQSQIFKLDRQFAQALPKTYVPLVRIDSTPHRLSTMHQITYSIRKTRNCTAGEPGLEAWQGNL